MTAAVRTPATSTDPLDDRSVAPANKYVPGDFELFVQLQAGPEVRRLGAELVSSALDVKGAEVGVIPQEYVIATGDEIQLLIWGSVDADLRLQVDRAGRISIPRVGPVLVAGIRYGDLVGTIERRVAQVFKNFQLSASLGQLRGIRVFVTGFVSKPGAYSVSALSTVVSALMRAGGPTSAGSFRQVELRRGGALVARFDLYDLLLKGDRSADRLVQAGDVVHVGPVGVQAAVIGSVNRPVIVEMMPGEGVAQALEMAGGFSSVADRSRLAIERLSERSGRRVAELVMPTEGAQPLSHGDVVRAFSAIDAVQSTLRQNKSVRIDGEVKRPGEYVLPPESTLQDAVAAAGGLVPGAFLYGAHLTRESVRATQQENYQRALRDLETDFARNSGSQRVSSGDQIAQFQVQSTAKERLIERLRALQPSGRVVLRMEPGAMNLPPLAVENGDRLFIPGVPSSVGVFGSVFNTGSYLFGEGRTLGDYLRLAGGPTKGADEGSIFVVRSNGQVVSGRQVGDGGWFSRGSKLGGLKAEPGDTIYVPEEMDKTTFIQDAKDWTQILYQLGIGIAGIKSATQ